MNLTKDQILEQIAQLEGKYNIPTGAFKQIVKQESSFIPGLTSKAGAIGLSQLMPGTARGLGVDPYDPMQNLEGGAKYYGQLLHNQAKGDPIIAAAQYNSGPNRKAYKTGHLNLLPVETQKYMAKFKAQYNPQGSGSTESVSAGMTDAELNALFAKQTQEMSTSPAQPDKSVGMTDAELNALFAKQTADMNIQTALPAIPTEQPQVTAPSTDRTLGSALAEAPGNIPESGLNLMKGTYEALKSPIETAKSLGNIGKGAAQLTSEHFGVNLGSDEAAKQAFTNFAESMANRYGSKQALYNTIATDPVGFLNDISPALKGTGLLAGKGAESLARSAETARSVAQSIQSSLPTTPSTAGVAGIISGMPDSLERQARSLNLGAKVASGARTGLDFVSNPISTIASKIMPLAPTPLAIASGINRQTYTEAFKAGKQSGILGTEASKPFTESMRGNIPTENVVDMARGALNNMRAAKNEQYTTQLAAIPDINTPLPANRSGLGPLEQVREKYNDLNAQHSFRGTTINPSVNNVRSQIDNALTEWQTNNAADASFSSIAGLDALKRRVADIVDSTEPHTPENRFASQIHNEIKGLLNNVSPQYRTMTSDYAKNIGQIKDIERELSLKEGSNPGTALRKLQSLMRNNANTSWDYRNQLGQQLIDAGAKDLIPSLAGQNLSSSTPRGLAAQLTSGVGAIVGSATMHPGLLALPLASPRFIGELAYGLGKAYQVPELLQKTPLRGSLLDYNQKQKDKENQ